jgi:hypothetical protein
MEAPYDRKPTESAKAYAAFTTYANLGPKRSLAAVGQALGKSEGLIERWSRRHGWGSRVRAHDAHLAAVEREAAEAQLRAKEAEGTRRKGELLEQEWAIHDDCMRAAREALKQFHENARRGATLGDIARLIEVGSKLGRLATGMPTDRTEVTGQEGGPMQLELSIALKKVYGEILNTTGDRRCGPAVEDRQILLLPRGDCTDPQPPAPPPPAPPPAPDDKPAP